MVESKDVTRTRFAKGLENMNKAFRKWTTLNQDKLPVELIPGKWRHKGREYNFSGSPHLRLWVSSWSFTVAVNYRNQCIDLVADWDILIKHSKKGFYCGLCTRRKKYFKSRAEMLIVHTFDPFLKWAQEAFVPDRFLVMVVWSSGSSMARICTKAEVKKVKRRRTDKFFIVKPVMQVKGGGKP